MVLQPIEQFEANALSANVLLFQSLAELVVFGETVIVSLPSEADGERLEGRLESTRYARLANTSQYPRVCSPQIARRNT
jgi:hypothetical protein